MRLITAFLFSLILQMGLAPSLQSQDTDEPETLSGRSKEFTNLARLPYQQLIKIAQSDAGSETDAESYRLRIQSRNSLVTSADIQLFLDLEGERLLLPVDSEGFVEVPYRQDLMESNPDLVANQPRGSLNIFVEIEIPDFVQPKIEDGKVSYQELFRPLLEMQEEMRKVNPIFGLTGQEQLILVLTTGGETVKITRELGSRTFSPDEEGKVYMIMEAYLYEENPLVEVPENLEVIVLPKSPEEIEEIRSR